MAHMVQKKYVLMLALALKSACEASMVRKHTYLAEGEHGEAVAIPDGIEISYGPAGSMQGQLPTVVRKTHEGERMEVDAHGNIERAGDDREKAQAISMARVIELESELNDHKNRIRELEAALGKTKKACAENGFVKLRHDLLDADVEEIGTDATHGGKNEMSSESFRWAATQKHVTLYYGGNFDLLESDMKRNRNTQDHDYHMGSDITSSGLDKTLSKKPTPVPTPLPPDAPICHRSKACWKSYTNQGAVNVGAFAGSKENKCKNECASRTGCKKFSFIRDESSLCWFFYSGECNSLRQITFDMDTCVMRFVPPTPKPPTPVPPTPKPPTPVPPTPQPTATQIWAVYVSGLHCGSASSGPIYLGQHTFEACKSAASANTLCGNYLTVKGKYDCFCYDTCSAPVFNPNGKVYIRQATCSSDAPSGYCPSGQVCNQGVCEAAVCDANSCSSTLVSCDSVSPHTQYRSGCLTYAQGFPKNDSFNCPVCTGTTRAYRAGNLAECEDLCYDLYADPTDSHLFRHRSLCKSGCNYMAENANGICCETPTPNPTPNGCCSWDGVCSDCGDDGTGWCHVSKANCDVCEGTWDNSGTPPTCLAIACRPCTATDPGCTHPGNADQAWCDAHCTSGANNDACPASYCLCAHAVYAITAANTSDCPSGTYRIESSHACEKAADILGFQYMGASTFYMHPRGCTTDLDNRVTHNFILPPAGQANTMEKLICARSSTCATHLCPENQQHKMGNEDLPQPDDNKCCEQKAKGADCMAQKLCEAEIGDLKNDTGFMCDCVFNHKGERNVTRCRKWLECLHQQRSLVRVWFKKLLEFSTDVPLTSNGRSLVQVSNSSHGSEDTCYDPSKLDVFELDCNCAETLQQKCGSKVDDQECLISHACSNPKVCDSWKNGRCPSERAESLNEVRLRLESRAGSTLALEAKDTAEESLRSKC